MLPCRNVVLAACRWATTQPRQWQTFPSCGEVHAAPGGGADLGCEAADGAGLGAGVLLRLRLRGVQSTGAFCACPSQLTLHLPAQLPVLGLQPRHLGAHLRTCTHIPAHNRSIDQSSFPQQRGCDCSLDTGWHITGGLSADVWASGQMSSAWK